MALLRYTAAQLLALRDSPLVTKPDNLPAIEQWIDESITHNHNNTNKDGSGNAQRGTRQQRPGLGGVTAAAAGGEGSPMGSFSTGRPTLGTRTSTLRGSGDDISLGPPRTMFPSSRNISKLSDFQDKGASSADATPGDEPENARSKFFSDRQLNRKSLNSDKDSGKDSWVTVRDRRDGQRDREERFGRHEKEDGERRNGFGDRHDPRWSNNRDDRRNGDGRGGWRDREQQRRDRDGDRGHTEREPEWMDDPVVKKDQEIGMTARTQEDFQKWKESMSKKNKGEDEREEPVVGPTPVEVSVAGTEQKPAVAPLKLQGFENSFGNWADSTPASLQNATTPSAAAPTTKAPAKPKTSRFASIFKPTAEESAPVAETLVQKAANEVAKTSDEDHEGFNRVLQMLGSTKIGQSPQPSAQDAIPTSPPAVMRTGINGTAAKPKSRFTDMFAQKDTERLQSPQQGGISLGGDSLFGGESRTFNEESQPLFGGRQAERHVAENQTTQPPPSESTISPVPGGIPFNALREQQPRPQSGRMNDIMFDPPSRGPPTPDVNIQNLLAQQRQRSQHTSNESQQLLNLLKKDTPNSRPASQQALPNNGGVDQAQVQHWLEQQQRSSMLTEPHAPKPRVPQQPPGLFEEQLMRNYPSEQHRQDQGPLPGMPEMSQRRTTQRAPPGFYDEQSIFLRQQQQQQEMRRHFNDGPPQPQLSGPGRGMGRHPSLAPMQIPPQQGHAFPSDFHQITSPGGQAGPPPGFNPLMIRHPPGFHNNNFFQQPQSQQREGPPPGFGGNMQSPPANAPPGFFPNGPQGVPPGFIQHVRSPTDGMPPQALRGNAGRSFDPFDLGSRR